ncbi:glutamate synthase [NADPH] large chain [Paraliobacillus quinghaiensis]|uniref:Glutamate synthase [NADPH] large chain n=1 Tax=Paraliobacillus quinghaiensis TaxID=470815 RepID=A0A917TWI2_9BACI|nr:glutamate synthase large subunit [Paraliobacillus quinghaiensis]GGM41448.1 glutamate synthase [NADPH] large chain [Paraliobacillus quinghaiensis]
MSYNQMPEAQGLYHPDFEHDACGIGLYAHIKGIRTHDIVQKGLKMLCQLDHRGGQGSDPNTGDGAGLMVQIPDKYFRKLSMFQLPKEGRYGVGMAFFTKNDQEREKIETKINYLIKQEGQNLLGWRSVPTDVKSIGIKAQETAPVVRQVFIGAASSIKDDLAFERKLYVIRKQAENWAKQNDHQFYFASLSNRTIVYKGLLTPNQVDQFYLELQDRDFNSAFSLVHSRFSTNTFPSWERAHPNRYLIHNGEINTMRGNTNWMRAREQQFVSEAFGDDLEKLLPILNAEGSDSSVLDNALEFFTLAGRKPAHAAMMLIPEPWNKNPHISPDKRAFYEYHSCLMEQWDGPTSITFTNGKQIGAILDRNGLRPARYYVTKDDYIVYSSEVGVIDVPEENILYKDRLSPGKMLLIDLEEGRIISDDEIKNEIISEHPYQDWLDDNLVSLSGDLVEVDDQPIDQLRTRQKAFGYTTEDINKYLIPMITTGKDPIGAMGIDMPLAVLSNRAQSLFNYFKQLFAQVTNPPIDAYREQIVTSTMTLLGAEGNILNPVPENSHRIQLETPVLSNSQLSQFKNNFYEGFTSKVIDTLFIDDLQLGLETIFDKADKAIEDGANILILSDRKMDENYVPVPALLAVSALHQHLVRQGSRTKASLIIETGETREVHHFAALLGYGVDAITPYLAFETYREEIANDNLAVSYQDAVAGYINNVTEGVIKVMSKMGISTVQSYRGAQIFEAVGISNKVIDQHFTGTASQIDGIGIATIAKEAILRHQEGYKKSITDTLEPGSDFQWRKSGEHHAYNPTTIHKLQWAARRGDYKLYKEFSQSADEERIGFLRNLFTFKTEKSISIDEVESVDSIVKRFKTGAMSFGSISQEAHESLAIAMNRLGGKSNSGEGGEDSNRYIVDHNGDNRRSAIKQIASGRFGAKSHYMVNADELQIKMAQGAKPGEGGQLPGDKVYPWIAKVRGSTPGVNLISPPPHHDIYSIEDLAQLIHDLKNGNRDARISVKLVSRSGVGTIASGVAKGNADVISVVGYDGGTGASPRTSIKHAGLPWELGLSEAHQSLMLNGLREQVILETDGKLLTGKDVVMAAILGAEEYGFATAPLVILGCVMMRVCHLDTCPVGVATQNPELRKKFTGDPDHIVNFMRFIAQEVREIMAKLGFRTITEMIGRTDILEISERAKSHWKAKDLDLSRLTYQPKIKSARVNTAKQDHKIDQSLDMRFILPAVRSAIETGEKVEASFPIRNINRVAGTIVGSEISKKYGEEGLPDDTITVNFTGSAGQSFGAFIPNGMTLKLTGDSNDYVGKGLSGGKIIVKAPKESTFDISNNVIAGNVCFYGATSGEAYINGYAGERFAVRNSGANIVVEGIGDHGCEYMTGGSVVVLGEVGKNFGAGMSGGIAYVLADDKDKFKVLSNIELIEFESLESEEEILKLRTMIQNHEMYTNSSRAKDVLDNWETSKQKFIKVIPKDYKLMLQTIESFIESGETEEEAKMSAFQAKKENRAVLPDERKKVLVQ